MAYVETKLRRFLATFGSRIAKQNMWVLLFVSNFFSILIGIGEPHVKNILILIVTCLVLFDLYTFYMMFNSDNKYLVVIYYGVIGIVIPFLFLVGFCKILYYDLGIDPVFAIGFAVAIYLLTPLVAFVYTQSWLSQEEKKKKNLWFGVIGMGSGLGVLIGNILTNTVSYQTNTAIAAIALVVLSFCFELAILNFYKYYLMKKYKKYI